MQGTAQSRRRQRARHIRRPPRHTKMKTRSTARTMARSMTRSTASIRPLQRAMGTLRVRASRMAEGARQWPARPSLQQARRSRALRIGRIGRERVLWSLLLGSLVSCIGCSSAPRSKRWLGDYAYVTAEARLTEPVLVVCVRARFRTICLRAGTMTTGITIDSLLSQQVGISFGAVSHLAHFPDLCRHSLGERAFARISYAIHHFAQDGVPTLPSHVSSQPR